MKKLLICGLLIISLAACSPGTVSFNDLPLRVGAQANTPKPALSISIDPGLTIAMTEQRLPVRVWLQNLPMGGISCATLTLSASGPGRVAVPDIEIAQLGTTPGEEPYFDFEILTDTTPGSLQLLAELRYAEGLACAGTSITVRSLGTSLEVKPPWRLTIFLTPQLGCIPVDTRSLPTILTVSHLQPWRFTAVQNSKEYGRIETRIPAIESTYDVSVGYHCVSAMYQTSYSAYRFQANGRIMVTADNQSFEMKGRGDNSPLEELHFELPPEPPPPADDPPVEEPPEIVGPPEPEEDPQENPPQAPEPPPGEVPSLHFLQSYSCVDAYNRGAGIEDDCQRVIDLLFWRTESTISVFAGEESLPNNCLIRPALLQGDAAKMTCDLQKVDDGEMSYMVNADQLRSVGRETIDFYGKPVEVDVYAASFEVRVTSSSSPYVMVTDEYEFEIAAYYLIEEQWLIEWQLTGIYMSSYGQTVDFGGEPWMQMTYRLDSANNTDLIPYLP